MTKCERTFPAEIWAKVRKNHVQLHVEQEYSIGTKTRLKSERAFTSSDSGEAVSFFSLSLSLSLSLTLFRSVLASLDKVTYLQSQTHVDSE